MSSWGMLASCASVAAVSIASPAWAHPLVDEGRAKYAEADLSGALDAFARAEASSDLSLDDLLTLLETRVLVQRALGDEDAAARDLRWLASVAPGHELPSEAPPEMARELEDLRASRGGPIAISVEGHATDSGVVLRARVERDPDGMVREVRIHHRELGMPWVTTAATEARVPAGTVEHWAEAVGPGGAVLATAASAEEPRRFSVEDHDGGEVAAGDDGVPLWMWIGGGAVAVGLVVIVAVLIGSGGGESDQTRPGFPSVEF